MLAHSTFPCVDLYRLPPGPGGQRWFLPVVQNVCVCVCTCTQHKAEHTYPLSSWNLNSICLYHLLFKVEPEGLGRHASGGALTCLASAKGSVPRLGKETTNFFLFPVITIFSFTFLESFLTTTKSFYTVENCSEPEIKNNQTAT